MRAAEAYEEIRSMIIFSSSLRPKKTCGRMGRGKGLHSVRAEKEEQSGRHEQDWAGAGCYRTHVQGRHLCYWIVHLRLGNQQRFGERSAQCQRRERIATWEARTGLGWSRMISNARARWASVLPARTLEVGETIWSVGGLGGVRRGSRTG